MEYYIASCVFTSQFPQLSFQIQEYIRRRREMPILRCCIPSYKIKEFEDLMPTECREGWAALPDGRVFQPGDRVYSLCTTALTSSRRSLPEWKRYLCGN